MAHQIQDGDRWAIAETASKLGVNPADLLAIIAYETAGTFSPDKVGGTNNLYQGLIQFGATERHNYGYSPTASFASQVRGPVYRFLSDPARNSIKGMDLAQLYSMVNAGSLNKDGTPRLNAREKSTGRTLADNINNIKKDWLPNAQQLYWSGPQFLQQYWTRYPPYDPTTGEVKTARLPAGFNDPDKLSTLIAKFVPEPVRAAVQMWAALSPEEQAAKEQAIASGEASPATKLAAADVPIPRANPRMEEANQRVADAERVAGEARGDTVIARYDVASGRLMPTEHASPEVATALGYTYGDRTDRPSGAAAAIESLTPTGTEGVRERTVSPTSVASASDLDWNDASSLRTNMGAPEQPVYNALAGARTAQPAAPVATPTPTPAPPAAPPPQPVETPQTATVSPTSVPSTTYPEPIRQPGFVSPQEVAASTIPVPEAQPAPVYDPLSSIKAPTPVPGTGPVEPPVTKQPNAPVTGGARKAAPAATPPAIRRPTQPVKAPVPNARPIHPDVQPFVLRSITGISGPGPFSKATVQHYLSQQNWHAPSFDPKAGGSLYPYFTDTRSGIGGYVTQSGKAFTYSLRQNPGQSSTGATGDELRAQAYSAANP